MVDFPRPYKPGFVEPVVQVGQNILVLDRQAYRLYTVAFIEPIPRSWPMVQNFGALAAGAQTAPISTQNILDMQFGELAQYRLRVLDDVAVTVRLPQAVTRFGTKNVNAEVGAFNAIYGDVQGSGDSDTELYVFEDQRPILVVRNPTGYALAQSRVAFWGIRYVLSGINGASSGEHIAAKKSFATIEDALGSGEKFTVVPMGGWGR